MLHFGQKNDRLHRLVEIRRQMTRILRNADDLVQSGRLALEPPKMFSDRILVSEKLSRECLVDHGHMP